MTSSPSAGLTIDSSSAARGDGAGSVRSDVLFAGRFGIALGSGAQFAAGSARGGGAWRSHAATAMRSTQNNRTDERYPGQRLRSNEASKPGGSDATPCHARQGGRDLLREYFR